MISEATVVSTQGIGWVDSPGIYSDAQTEGWKRVVDTIHRAGGVILLQLWHCGRASHSAFHLEDGAPVAPSPIAIQGDGIQTPAGRQPHEVPRALGVEEIPQVVDAYRQAAKQALRAGCDGVEIHGANGYLIDQFLQSKTNRRTDRYGGSLENRYRFLDDIVQAVTAEVPAARVGVRLSPNGVFNDMGSPDFRETFTFAAQQLDRCGLAYLHLVDGLARGFHKLGEPMTLPEFRRVFHGPLIGNAAIRRPPRKLQFRKDRPISSPSDAPTSVIRTSSSGLPRAGLWRPMRRLISGACRIPAGMRTSQPIDEGGTQVSSRLNPSALRRHTEVHADAGLDDDRRRRPDEPTG